MPLCSSPGYCSTETDHQLLQAEEILRSVPDVESYSRRTGARLALAIAEPNTGDFLGKLRRDRKRKTDEVIAELRQRFNTELPGLNWEFPGIFGDLIGDLMWAPVDCCQHPAFTAPATPQPDPPCSLCAPVSSWRA